ncbi:MAG: hypothetical protein ACRD13_14250, partial [Terriglobales bacterium]
VTVAYFLQFLAPGGDRRDAISAADLRDGCRKARVKQPKGARRALANAHAMGYLDRAGRGLFKVNAIGENLVAMALPRLANNGADRGGTARGHKSGPGRTAAKRRKPVRD